jgi:hypothetical protein
MYKGNGAKCVDCGYQDDVNSFDIDAMDEGDPSPVITCPKCGGVAEIIDEE